ncbi:DUF1652 domain-containing protein [Pseudomonas sp. WHRI 8822A]|jgi:hypothetical protein|uniref:DUF1652 domain-containing protein n=1 Tax=Pseudomonas sp. WHRI 8822A TaxID=3162568 RepID=UPI0032EF473F
MPKMKLKVAVRHIHHYFAPLRVTVTPSSPVTMDVELADPSSEAAVTLFDIPCRNTLTPSQLIQLINLIETQVKNRNPDLFDTHRFNRRLHP